MKHLVFACLLAPGIAFAAPPRKDAYESFQATLEPAKPYEQCMRLEAREKRQYYWKADAPVDFNIHYHDGPESFYPVKRSHMRGDGGTFAAKKANEYCWSWIARNGARLEGAIERK